MPIHLKKKPILPFPCHPINKNPLKPRTQNQHLWGGKKLNTQPSLSPYPTPLHPFHPTFKFKKLTPRPIILSIKPTFDSPPVKHCLDFSFVFSARLPAWRNLFWASEIFCWNVPVRLYWDLLTNGRYQPTCHNF